MNNKFYKLSIALCLFVSLTLVGGVKAQTVIYNENFDGQVLTFPSGWTADTANGGWQVDSTNVDTIQGASGYQNITISNATGLSGTFNLTSKSISTTGYDNINVLWDARLTKHFRDSGSTIESFDYSTDGGGTWTNIPYTENPSNGSSFWYADNGGARINLPANANNQATVKFRWVASLASTSSGTYRIDDFNVQGTLANGISEYKDQDVFKLYMDRDKLLHLDAKPSFSMPSASFVTISDITGRECLNARITTNNNTYSLSELKQGVYFIKITAGSLLFVQKIVCD